MKSRSPHSNGGPSDKKINKESTNENKTQRHAIKVSNKTRYKPKAAPLLLLLQQNEIHKHETHHINLFHFLESINDLSSGNPRFQGGNNLGFDVWDEFSNALGRKRSLHQLPDASVIFSLVKEQCRRAY